MITLGIIGVVAAITIPGLISTYQKRAAIAGIKEAQSIINQAIKMYVYESDDEGETAFDTTLPIQTFAEKYFKPYLNVAQVCTKMSDGCWKTGNFYGYYDLAGNKKTDTVPYSLVLNNGMVFGFNKVADGSYNLISIIVDINGKSSKNVMGRDVFSFYLFNQDTVKIGQTDLRYKNIKNGVYPGGYAEGGIPHAVLTREELLDQSTWRSCNKNSYNASSPRPGIGAACAALIFKDGWNISKDYPW